jgi:hypothetical protein
VLEILVRLLPLGLSFGRRRELVLVPQRPQRPLEQGYLPLKRLHTMVMGLGMVAGMGLRLRLGMVGMVVRRRLLLLLLLLLLLSFVELGKHSLEFAAGEWEFPRR